jgi:DNA-binding MarR family transcriptional regulator
VSRRPDPADARAVRLALTDRGTDVIERAMPVVRALDAQLTSPLGGPGSPGLRALTAALQTLLDATPQTGDTT